MLDWSSLYVFDRISKSFYSEGGTYVSCPVCLSLSMSLFFFGRLYPFRFCSFVPVLVPYAFSNFIKCHVISVCKYLLSSHPPTPECSFLYQRDLLKALNPTSVLLYLLRISDTANSVGHYDHNGCSFIWDISKRRRRCCWLEFVLLPSCLKKWPQHPPPTDRFEFLDQKDQLKEKKKDHQANKSSSLSSLPNLTNEGSYSPITHHHQQKQQQRKRSSTNDASRNLPPRVIHPSIRPSTPRVIHHDTTEESSIWLSSPTRRKRKIYTTDTTKLWQSSWRPTSLRIQKYPRYTKLTN